jgi:cyanophycin synthetase
MRSNPTLSLSLLLDALGRAGTPGRELAPRLDLVRSIGPGYAWREQRRRSAARSLPSDGRRAGYVERWSDAARQIGAQATDLSRGFVELHKGDARIVVWNHWVPLDDIVTLKLALEKPLVHQILAAEGLPVPEHELFHAGDLAPALKFLKSGDTPCVVKPVDREGGAVTTTGVRTAAHLRRARLRAQRISQRLLIERQVPGDNYRFLFLDGQLLDVVRRRPPRVFGDGRSTVRELIVAENRKRHAAAGGAWTWDLFADLDTVFTLEGAGLTLASVPADGEPVIVKTVINANGPQNTESVRHDVSDALVADVSRAVDLLGVRLAGVDVITPDCRQPLAAAGGVILEVNATPGLHYHYDIRNPDEGVPVLLPILHALFGEPAVTGARRKGTVTSHHA